MRSISCRSRDAEVRNEPLHHFPNYSVQYVDGKKQIVETEPVVPDLAENHSVIINSISRHPSSSMSKRLNVDAVDLQGEIQNLQKS